MNDRKWMQQALNEALKGLGRTQTNPLVGCAIVKNGQKIGQGHHAYFGGRHAEADALQKLGKKAKGSTLYVTLEPCCHTDKKTPPCVPTIVKAKVAHLVIAMKDPHAQVSGKGIQALKKAGIKVTVGVLGAEAKELNPFYLKWIKTGMPFVLQKIGMSANGIIYNKKLKGNRITGKESKQFLFELRNILDANMVSVNTVKIDNPQLTARIKNGRNPVRVVLDTHLEVPMDAKLLREQGKTIIFCSRKASQGKQSVLEKKFSVEVVRVQSKRNLLDLKTVFKELGKRNIASVLVEGGKTLNTEMIQQKLCDRLFVIIAPKLLKSGLAFADVEKIKNIKLKVHSSGKLGGDILLDCTLD